MTSTMTPSTRTLSTEQVRQIKAQAKRRDAARAKLEAEERSLEKLVVALYEETGAPMETIGDYAGVTKQRIHQFITAARATRS